MENEEKIRRIILERTGMSRAELDKLVEKKIKEFAGLLTELGALYTIAKEKGIDLEIDRSLGARKKISELKPGMKNVFLLGVVKRAFMPRSFDRDGRKGKYASVILTDGTGDIRLVLWNRDADLVAQGKIRKGTVIEVLNGKVEEYRGKLSLRLGYDGRFLINPPLEEGVELPSVEAYKVRDLGPDMNDVDIVLKVMRVFPEGEAQTEKGPVRYLSFIGADETGSIRVVLWGDRPIQINEGETVRILSGYTREDDRGLTLHVGQGGNIVKEDIPLEVSVRKKIEELQPGERAEVRGIVVAVYSTKPYSATCNKCGGRAIWKDGEWICTECGSKDVRVVPILSFEIDDGTGTLRAVLFGEKAKEIYGDKFPGDESLQEAENKLLGRDFIFSGSIRKNELLDRLEIVVDSLREIDFFDEYNRLVEEVERELEEKPERGSRTT